MTHKACKLSLFKQLQSLIALFCAFVLVVPPVQARNKKGDRLLKLAQKAEAAKDYDSALNYYDQAIETDPMEPAYLLPEQRVRDKAANAHVTEGRKLQVAQKLDEALMQFQKALLSDPSSQIALQEIRQTTAMIKERDRSAPGTPILTPAERSRQDIEKRINSLEGPPVLRPISAQISSIKMNSQPARVLYETVGKLAGINVLLDPQGIESVPGKQFNLDLNNVTLEEALNYIALETHTFWKPISRNAIFVTQETEPKRAEYQDEIVKVFYIQNAATPNEFTEIFNALRSGAKITTGLFSLPTQNAVIARGSVDTIALVEKLIHDLDRPKPEVVVDVIVMEVSRNKTSTLGAALAGQTGGLNVPIQFTPRNPILFGNTGSSSTGSSTTTTTSGTTGTSTSTGTTTGTSTSGTTSGIPTSTTSSSSGEYISLSQVGHISTNDFSISMPGALVQALMTDAATRILQRPQVRVTDNGKASLKIGSKIPYVSGSLNSAVATPGSIPYATTQFQQVDVGTNIDLEPHVNGPDEVSMKIKVEISDVIQTENIAGVQQPIIGQKVNEAQIRMKDGEVSVLGGLYDEETDYSASGIPGVTNMPLLGYLFGTKTRTHNKDEVLIALIPHIVRPPDLSSMGDEGVLAGTERVVRVEHKPASAAGGMDGTPSTGAQTPVPNVPAPPLSPVPNRPPATTPPAGATRPPEGVSGGTALPSGQPATPTPTANSPSLGGAGAPLTVVSPTGTMQPSDATTSPNTVPAPRHPPENTAQNSAAPPSSTPAQPAQPPKQR